MNQLVTFDFLYDSPLIIARVEAQVLQLFLDVARRWPQGRPGEHCY